jgi:hypothetical protein
VSTPAPAIPTALLACGCRVRLKLGALENHKLLGECCYCGRPVYRCEDTDTPRFVVWMAGLIAHRRCVAQRSAAGAPEE